MHLNDFLSRLTRLLPAASLLWASLPLAAAGAEPPPKQSWHRAAPPLPSPTGQVIRVNNVEQLYQAAERQIKPGGTILLADGVYQMPRYFNLGTDRVTLRSASGNRDAVILDGANSRHGTLLAVTACAGVTIADLTVRNVMHNGVQIQSYANTQQVTVRNCVLHNIWQRGVKGVKAKEHPPRDCVIEHCLFYNDRPKQYGDDTSDTSRSYGGNYLGGIDVMDAVGWQIRDNVFVNLQGRTREGRGAIFVWFGSRDCVIERNVIVDCDAGILLGNPQPPEPGTVHASDCVVRNNFITRTPEQAIFCAFTRDCRLLHNSIHDPENRRRRSIRAILGNPGLTIANNLVHGSPPLLDNAEQIKQAGNLFRAAPPAFRDPAHGDLHLRLPTREVVDAGAPPFAPTEDFDRQPRGEQPDIGADEYAPAN